MTEVDIWDVYYTTDNLLYDENGILVKEHYEPWFYEKYKTKPTEFTRFPYGKYISLSSTKAFELKHLSKFCTPIYHDKFPTLVKWVKEQKILEDFGRISIYFSTSHAMGITHSDVYRKYNNVQNPRIDQFIWINPFKKKKFFMLDHEKNIKHYVQSEAAWFNTYDFHGSDPCDAFTVKIDGVFKKDFLEEIGYIPKPDLFKSSI